jgi:hypothetical protein
MRSTCTGHAAYVGADLTDAYAHKPRSIDVCGLVVEATGFVARFWEWTYEGGLCDIEALLPEIRAAGGTILDGPQALARAGAAMRECERKLGAAGKTPGTLPAKGPFSGFVRTSVELFAALAQAGIPVSPPSLTGAIGEHYPGGNWRCMGGALPSKRSAAGLEARRSILERLGVRFPFNARLTHDHLDAALGAVIAAVADGVVPGARVERVGANLVCDGGALREGPILILRACEA